MRLPILEVNQDGNVFYISKIKAKDLINISTTKVRNTYTTNDYKNYLDEVEDRIKKEINEMEIWYLKDTKENTNIQRKRSEERLKEIGDYISKANSIFPNSIIISLNRKNEADELQDVIKITENELEFDESKVIATIIDGQHRLGGFNYTDNKDYFLENFELVITIMIDLEVALQAELFGTINGKQKPVSKSILYDLSELSENEYTETVTAHLIAKWFNLNKKSPLLNKIKMLGYGEGTISQSAFIDALLPLIQEKNFKSLKSMRVFPIFRNAYVRNDTKFIMQQLFNYFSCFSKLFPIEWDYQMKRGDKVRFILNKTTGISGILFAYPTIFAYCMYHDNYKKDFICELLEKLKSAEFDFSSDTYSGGSKSTQNKLADDILNVIFDNDEIELYRKYYLDNYKSL
ncbi:hypothetical protein COD82_19170 [Bacillus cereus]|uniref:DGQHR domain-containing protein n=1 Tax=Bacillus cereus TaxID=1396 RepID=UPI000BF90C56|nr:DGQHR domain-containing protein [Bacillus cereus]MEB9844370.1 DGQHR domain-containing protein [Bacillus cereus]MEC0072109.1 DGQHR domain-containing protein [Bacillus cereus]PEZ16891.1 hypothetical protein CN365_21070 [Bacillus cereus]PEZ97309.1 hypothetical protein CN375_16570 [Bacillus cereus]PGL07892.1 hypothetical protein CN915_18505 [Bacillus cereus]